MEKVTYNRGASGLNGSMADSSPASMESGFDDVTPKTKDPWKTGYEQQDNSGENYVGSIYERRRIGACGRPEGDER